MRLIDADEFIKKFRYSEAENDEEKLMCATVRRLIREEPTAYDVDKVAEQLKEEQEDSNADFEQYAENHGLDEENDFHFEGLKRAISIVKGGGING